MEFDIVPELLKKIKEDYEKNVAAVNTEELLSKLLKSKNLDDAYAYARKIGQALSDAFAKNISADLLPNGRMYFNIANRLIPPTLTRAYKDSANISEIIMANINAQNKIGMMVQQGIMNADRITGMVDRLSEAEKFEDVKFLTGRAVMQNVTQSAVDDTIEANAQFQYKSGIRARVERKLGGKCCAWCQRLKGNYTYPNVPQEVFQRHENCRCTVIYYPSKTGKGQDVWSKKEVNPEYSENEKQLANIRKEKVKAFASGKNCYDATEEWYYNKKNFSIIKNNDKFIDIDGIKYEVDGKNIIFNPSDAEKNVAKLLVDNFGGTIELNPRISFPQNIKLADYYYNNKSVDLKTIEGNSKHVIYNIIKNKKGQAKSFVIDISLGSITKDIAIAQIENDVFRSSHTRFVENIILIKDNKILNVFQRI